MTPVSPSASKSCAAGWRVGDQCSRTGDGRRVDRADVVTGERRAVGPGGHEFPRIVGTSALREPETVDVPAVAGVVVAEDVERQFGDHDDVASVAREHRIDRIPRAHAVRNDRDLDRRVGLAVGEIDRGGPQVAGGHSGRRDHRRREVPGRPPAFRLPTRWVRAESQRRTGSAVARLPVGTAGRAADAGHAGAQDEPGAHDTKGGRERSPPHASSDHHPPHLVVGRARTHAILAGLPIDPSATDGAIKDAPPNRPVDVRVPSRVRRENGRSRPPRA